MRTQIVYLTIHIRDIRAQLLAKAPWAAAWDEVDSGSESLVAFLCFESVTDFKVWRDAGIVEEIF